MQDNNVYCWQQALCNCQPLSTIVSFVRRNELSESSIIQVIYSLVSVMYFISHSKEITDIFPSFPKINSGTQVITQSRFTYFIQQC